MKKALILVDLQNDFCPGGSLPVPHGADVVKIANQIQPYFDLIVATKDWHPETHLSFAENHPHKKVGDTIKLGKISQMLWPKHCVQNTQGAEFHPNLNTQLITTIFHKGSDTNIDSYSAFFDNEHLRSTGLSDYLKDNLITDVYLMGLATDYCVKYSTLDAIHLGFNVFVIEDGCRGVELIPGDSARALNEMKALGATLIQSSEILQSNP